jgi:hypothetical protein
VERLVATTNEWELLKQQFDATTQDESVESIEDIFDAQFRRRFAELINQIAQPDSPGHHIDWRPRQRS